LIDGGPVPALSKYARREVTGISFLTRSIFKETAPCDIPSFPFRV
jgi:hypothetical protein